MPVITPAARVAPTPLLDATGNEVTGFRAQLAGPFDVVLNTNGSDGRVHADVPLDSFVPPLTREQLAGLSMRVSLPPNATGTTPITLVEQNGRTSIRVDLEKAEIGLLSGSPMVIGIGEKASLGVTSMPKLTLQVSARTLHVDRSAPAARMQLDSRAQSAHSLESLKRDLVELKSGTSTWFGSRQLDEEHATLATLVRETKSAADAMRADLETKLASAEPAQQWIAMPDTLPERATAMAAINAGRNAARELPNAQELRATFVELKLDAELPAQDAKIAGLQQALDAEVKSYEAVVALYQSLRGTEVGDAWLEKFGAMHGVPNFAGVKAEASRAVVSLAYNEKDRARVQANTAANLPGAVANLEASIARMAEQLERADLAAKQLKDGTKKELIDTATAYPPEMNII